MRKTALAIGYLVLCFSSLKGQDSTALYIPKQIPVCQQYFKSYLTDTKDIVLAPLQWNNKEWMIATGVIGTTGILLTQDKTINDVVQKNKNKESCNFSKYVFEPWGNNYSFGLVGLFYAEGLIFKNERSKNFAKESVKTIAITSLFTQLAKYATQRRRPYQTNPSNPYDADEPFEEVGTNKSFFSGHASVAFAVATALSMEYKEHKWLPYVAYTIAAGTACSRVHDKDHWASDVFAGAAAGYFIARIIHKNDVKRKALVFEKRRDVF